MFATASSYWSWGWGDINFGTSTTVSTGPWLAGQVWSAYPVPCVCSGGWCTSFCWVGTRPLEWSHLNEQNVCGPLSAVYLEWARPLGYCTFPPGFVPPEVNLTAPPTGSTGYLGEFGGVPDGTTFAVPQQVTAVQALMILSTILVFFACTLGCADVATEYGERRSKCVSGTTALFSFLGFVFCLTAYCVWISLDYVQRLQSREVSMPVWYDNTENQLAVVQVRGITYGPGWITALCASLLSFIATLFQCLSLTGSGKFEDAPAPQEQYVYQQEAIPVVQGELVQPQPPPAMQAPPPAIGKEVITV